MKKIIIVAILATLSVSAFAQKHMIKLDGCFNGGGCDSLDFNMDSNDKANTASSETKSQNLAFNYAYNINGTWGVGIGYAKGTSDVDGKIVANASTVTDDSKPNNSEITISGYWNKDASWNDSCFAALHYTMTTNEDLDAALNTSGYKANTIGLEYGHRYTLGKLMGVNWNWTPSVRYNMTTVEPNTAASKDEKLTDLAINVANFAVTF